MIIVMASLGRIRVFMKLQRAKAREEQEQLRRDGSTKKVSAVGIRDKLA
jgi:hypothetical protein